MSRRAFAKLKQQPGQDLVMYGCHDLMHRLLEHDFIDEYRILVHPVLLGKGRSFLKDGAERVNLDLVDTTVISSGVTVISSGAITQSVCPRRPPSRPCVG
jgi:dihydrofolate reductase